LLRLQSERGLHQVEDRTLVEMTSDVGCWHTASFRGDTEIRSLWSEGHSLSHWEGDLAPAGARQSLMVAHS
jgi:hypothetical protein